MARRARNSQLPAPAPGGEKGRMTAVIEREGAPQGRAVPAPEATTNPIRTREEWERARGACEKDPGRFHGDIAKRELHWFVRTLGVNGAWIRWDDGARRWTGFDAANGLSGSASRPESHEPWARAFDDDAAPFYRWFAGGLTNACFNEVDRHVLAGFGDEPAFVFEGDRWDQSLDKGRGGPVRSEVISRKRLLVEVAKAAVTLRDLGLVAGDRIALNMPNIPEQAYFTEAAKRLGVIYTPVFGGFSDKTLSDRIHDAGASVVITADGGHRNAQVIPFKEAYTDPALDRFVPVEAALGAVGDRLAALGVPRGVADTIAAAAREGVRGEITVERSDIMRGVGRALADLAARRLLAVADASRIRTGLAQALVSMPPRVRAVVVVRHTGRSDILWRPERDRWAHELGAKALATILAIARAAGVAVEGEEDLLALDDQELVRAVWATTRPEPLDADFPMFIIYTSGSTGKPKGVVHVHGGYVSGIAHTMRVAFDARPGDVIYTIADPGWITGQSYLYSAPLATRVTSVMAEGAPVFPSSGRFASIIERYGVRILKAGVTFLKTVMQDPQSVEDVRQYDLSTLRVATFCAEPTSPAVQEFAMTVVTPWYINSYWATEHGGIVWTHLYGNGDFPLRPDGHCYPLPWVFGDVWLPAADGRGGGAPRPAMVGERGEVVVTAAYPYLCRTIWGDVERFRVEGSRVSPEWRGDIERFTTTYWSRWDGVLAYTQGDVAVKHPDGGFSFHGRSDDVINVSGHRLGTEEIEGAILRDTRLTPDSPVGNVIVVGAPHHQKGLTPLAFVKTTAGRRLTSADRARLEALVREEKGALAVPSELIEVAQFPETRSGKYVRRMVRALVEGASLGDTSTLRNPESIEEISTAIALWRDRQRATEVQRLFETYRYFRVQYDEVAPGARVATVTVTNPPVNALTERALDELNTVVDHLARRDDVRAVIFTGSGGSSFVAGADVRQLLEELDTLEQALPLPNNAHLAFQKIERMEKPCVAAINGVALGGGLEFALACHYRIAEPTARFGQPEIRLSIIPGFGGTQRLPRLLAARTGTMGLSAAVEAILGGRSMDAATALHTGLVDEVVEGSRDVLTRAGALARELAWESAGDGGASTLARAHARRQAENAEWERPGTFPIDDVIASPDVARLVRQGREAGREGAVSRALEAIRYGWTHGVGAGLKREAELFATAVIDPSLGKRGIRAFLEKRSAPLPTRSRVITRVEAAELAAEGELLPVGSPFYPGVTPIPRWQWAQAVVRDDESGEPLFGDPATAEREVVVPVVQPGPNEALVYVLASEVNVNDIWAITGIPVSPFDAHDEDIHVTGSGAVGLVAAMGSEARAEGRVAIGDLVVVYSGQSDLLSPLAGLDPMVAELRIQGYETPDGSHQQFVLVQGPQLTAPPRGLALEAAGSYVLNLGTVVRALFTTLEIAPGKTMLAEGAATGTGLEALKAATRNGVRVVGMVSSEERAEFVRRQGAVGVVRRTDERFRHLFTLVPEAAEEIEKWERAGAPLVEEMRRQIGGRLADYVVSHAGETAFPRSFQLLETGGTLTFYGASSGYHFTFVGKPGEASSEWMLRRARLRAGESVLLYYGVGADATGLVDQAGLEAVEAARAAGARIVVATLTDAQREFVESLGFGGAVAGVVSLEEIGRRHGPDFDWPRTMPPLPDARRDTAAFREAVRAFQERTVKPFGAQVGRLLRSDPNPRGQPDLVFERAGHDALAISTSLVRPFTGRVVYCEEMRGRRYSFYAPQVWMRQRRILMPTASILGTHLSNAYEVIRMNEMVAAGLLEVTEPLIVSWKELPQAHQAMWENRHAGASYVCNHALPALGLKSRDALFEAWAALGGGKGA